MLFLTEGFPHDAGEEPSRRVVRAAERVNAAVYFVDVRGVVASPPWASADAPNDAELNSSRMIPEQVLQIKEMMARAARDRLMTERYIGVETMAEETGGLILRGTNDLGPGLARISAESRSYYLLGYHPTSPARGGQFRKIEVKVTRPGLSVRARKGYEAAGPARAEAPRAREEGADVPLRLATYTLEPVTGGKTRVLAAVEVDFAALTAEERKGRRVAHLELRVETSARDGGEGWIQSLSVEGEPRPAAAGSAPQWETVRVEFELPAGLHQVRASARENATGKVGVVTQRVQVPEPTGLRLSTPIVLGQRGRAEPGDERTPAAGGRAPELHGRLGTTALLCLRGDRRGHRARHRAKGGLRRVRARKRHRAGGGGVATDGARARGGRAPAGRARAAARRAAGGCLRAAPHDGGSPREEDRDASGGVRGGECRGDPVVERGPPRPDPGGRPRPRGATRDPRAGGALRRGVREGVQPRLRGGNLPAGVHRPDRTENRAPLARRRRLRQPPGGGPLDGVPRRDRGRRQPGGRSRGPDEAPVRRVARDGRGEGAPGS